MRIFITGATGVVGLRAVPLLLAAGHQVSAVARTPVKRGVLERMGAVAVRVNLFDPDAVRRAVAGHDVIVNLATSIPSTLRSFLPGAWSENDRIRRIASSTLVDTAMAAGAEKFVQESFAPIYADRGDQWIDERSPIQPARYSRTVVDAERAVERFTKSGRTGIVLRFTFFYGPDSGFTLDMIRSVRRGWAPIFGSADRFISSVMHDDAASAVVAALGAGAGIYNVTDDDPVRRREFVDSLAELLGVVPPKIPPTWMRRAAGSLGELLARSQRISNRKLRDETGWAPRYPSVREGWQAVVETLRGPARVP